MMEVFVVVLNEHQLTLTDLSGSGISPAPSGRVFYNHHQGELIMSNVTIDFNQLQSNVRHLQSLTLVHCKIVGDLPTELRLEGALFDQEYTVWLIANDGVDFHEDGTISLEADKPNHLMETGLVPIATSFTIEWILDILSSNEGTTLSGP